MKKACFNLVLGLSIALCGCNGAATTPSPTPPPASATPHPTTTPTATPLPDTPTPAEPPTAWNLSDPFDPAAEGLLLPDGDGFKLDPAWAPVHIDYIYEWWGLGDPVLDYQQLDYQNGQYHKDAVQVPAEKIKSLISALGHLYPTQFMLSSTTHTDDYPSWTVELSDQQGRRILLNSASNGNTGAAPWNVFYNGRLYAQFDGSLAGPLGDLFPSQAGQPAAAFFPGGQPENSVIYSTSGWPAELIDGFEGLLPLADGFQYRTDLAAKQVKGYIQGSSSIGGMGHMVIGTITKLEQVSLAGPDGKAQACDIQPIKSDDPAGAAWTFTCAAADAALGARYRYPLKITVETKTNKRIDTAGALVGTWGPASGVMHLPLPKEIQTALANNPAAHDLLADHIAINASYSGELDSAILPDSATLVGELLLLGQTQVQGQALRYTVGTPFAIQEGRLVHWKLTRAALDQMLTAIGQLGLTKRIVQKAQAPVLNLWYDEPGEMPKISGLMDRSSQGYSMQGAACGDVPAWSLPNAKQPLEAFAFNSSWGFWTPDFVLLNGRPVVASLDLRPNQDDRGGLLSLLIPAQLDTAGHLPFTRVWMEDGESYGVGQAALTLGIPDKPDAASLARYNQIAASLPVAVDKKDYGVWTAAGMTFVVQDDGQIGIKACGN